MTDYWDVCPECGGQKLTQAKLCRSCYRRPRNPVELVLARVVEHEADGCLLFTGPLNGSGYGVVHYGGRKNLRRVRAHRVMYEAFVGPIPEGLTLDHLCRRRNCVNPAHLEPVTNAENVMRGESVPAKNARKTHCKRGHKFTPENTSRRSNRTSRECKTCVRDAARAYRREKSP